MPIEHPEPSDATVKKAYAHAFRCAAPNCRRPLYHVDPLDSSRRTLNSRIAHICARSEGGPRWREMSADENRSWNNLVVLCIEHAAEVDAPGWEARFPENVLQEWRAAQLREFDQLGAHGVNLSDEEVHHARGDTYVLGGEGGQGTQSGGGGGGAIGPGATGGPGGPGGNHYVFDGWPGASPGAGGGGGGAQGDGAAGGDGGGGGDKYSFILRADDIPESIDFHLGRAGRGGQTPGETGQHAEDSVLRAKMADGTERELRLPGVRGGGRTPVEVPALPELFPSLLTLSDYATVRDGVLFMSGAAWHRCIVKELPAQMAGFVVAVLHRAPGHMPDGISLRLLNPMCETVWRTDLLFGPTSAAERVGEFFLVPFNVTVDVAGRWLLALCQGSRAIAVYPLKVELTVPGDI